MIHCLSATGILFISGDACPLLDALALVLWKPLLDIITLFHVPRSSCIHCDLSSGVVARQFASVKGLRVCGFGHGFAYGGISQFQDAKLVIDHGNSFDSTDDCSCRSAYVARPLSFGSASLNCVPCGSTISAMTLPSGCFAKNMKSGRRILCSSPSM